MASYLVEGEGLGLESYRVRDPDEGTQYSLRLVRGPLPAAIRDALLRLRHPNLASVIDIAPEGEDTAVVSELLQGRTLGDWLVDTNRVSNVETVSAIGAGIARGLAAAHDSGLIHGHLAPNEIVLVTDRGDLCAKLIGVGLGDHVEPHEPGFRAPEHGPGQAPHTVDLWSLGALLHCMFTGAAPKGSTDAIRSQLDAADADMPASLVRLILRLLDGDPANRPTAAATAMELTAWVSEPTRTAPMPVVRVSSPDTLPDVPLPDLSASPVLAAVVGALAGVGLFASASALAWWGLG